MNKFTTWLAKNSGKILTVMIGAYVLVVSAICIWKYQHFLYNGLDLAIFNNALFNTVNGDWWWSTIQGHNYLGDHFEPILILFLPIYYFWQSPILLLILQTLALGLAAWPIYLVVKKIYLEEPATKDPVDNDNSGIATSSRISVTPRNDKIKVWPLAISFLWLINPLVHNLNLFEFHAIAFLPFLSLWLFYIYLKFKKQSSKRLILCFNVLMLLCLMVREDVAFIILTFLAIIWFSDLKNKYLPRITLGALVITIVYLIISFQLISHFSPSGFSPFAYYYGWLGKANIAAIIKHLLTLTNLEMVLGFLAPFFFLPIIKPRWLLITLIPLGQIIMSAAGGGAQVWQLHYGALFLPALVIAFIYSWQRADNYVARKFQSPGLLLAIIIIFNLCLWPSFGPWHNNKTVVDEQAVQAMIKKIEPDASVLASYRLLPNISSRAKVYSLHYYFLGVQQFAQAEYNLNGEIQYLILDKEDYQQYDEILKTSAWAGQYYGRGYERLEALLSAYQKIDESGRISLWRKN